MPPLPVANTANARSPLWQRAADDVKPSPSTSSRPVPKSASVEVVVCVGSLDDDVSLELLLEDDSEEGESLEEDLDEELLDLPELLDLLELLDFVVDGRVTVDSVELGRFEVDLRVVVVVVVVVVVDVDEPVDESEELELELDSLLLDGDFGAEVLDFVDCSLFVKSSLPRVSARPIATAITRTRAVATAPMAMLRALELPEFFCADMPSSSQI